MAFTIKTTRDNQVAIKVLTDLFKFRNDSITARLGITYSLQRRMRFTLAEEYDLDSGGKEFREDTIFGRYNDSSNYPLYKALFDSYYQCCLTEADFYKLVKIHMDFGIRDIYQNVVTENSSRYVHLEFMINALSKGLSNLSERIVLSENDMIQGMSEMMDDSFSKLIEIQLGRFSDDSPVRVRLNDLKEFDSHHIAIAGMTGSGKTELVKDLLYQISLQSNYRLKYIFFDYKGEGKSEKLWKFLQATQATLIDVALEPFGINPLSNLSESNSRLRGFSVQNVVDIIGAINPSIGNKQKHYLRTAINDCLNAKPGNAPSLQEVFVSLKEFYEENRISVDSLYASIEQLSNGLFSDTDQLDIRSSSLYVSLPKSIADTTRQLFVFLTLQYLLNMFSRMNDVMPDSDRINPIRYVIVIDEAHVYLKNKQARKALEEVLRVIRSKGVVVILLSQGPSDYKTVDFDFASQIKIPICLNVNDKDYRIVKSFLGTPRSEVSMRECIAKLSNGKGVVNIGEPNIIDINQFWMNP